MKIKFYWDPQYFVADPPKEEKNCLYRVLGARVNAYREVQDLFGVNLTL